MRRPGDRPPRRVVVAAIGAAQILAWGSSYYLIAVLAVPIAADTGWTLPWIVAGPSIGLLVSGLVSPRVGKSIQRNGGRPVLVTSAVLLATGLLALAAAPGYPFYGAAWVLIGLGMGTGLYDPAFATLGTLYGAGARSAITQMTLIAGFASTVCWPLTAALAQGVGWRGACAAYALLDLAILLPLYVLGVPRGEPRDPAAPRPPSPGVSEVRGATADRTADRTAFALLVWWVTVSAGLLAIMSVLLLTLLQGLGLAAALAVALGALLGPSQVAGRMLELVSARGHTPLLTMLGSAGLVAIGLAVVLGAPGIIAIGLGVVIYGAGMGLATIARGTVPLFLFGPEEYATHIGRLARPALLVQAAAPILGALLLDVLGVTATLGLIVFAAVVNMVPAVALRIRTS